MNAVVLIFLLDAVVKDDVTNIRKLIHLFPCMAKKAEDLTADELEFIRPTKMCNYFYVYDHLFGLVIEDTPNTRTLATDRELNALIYWGPNTDPVQHATVSQIVDAMRMSEKHNTPSNVIGFFKALHDSEDMLNATQRATQQLRLW